MAAGGSYESAFHPEQCKNERKALRITLYRLGRMSGVAPGLISAFENGRRIDAEKLRAVRAALHAMEGLSHSAANSTTARQPTRRQRQR
ncbi:helix-turn-helix domain-containing protein [Shinella granuli]|uniref:helix-turn-helix domain-containing protein n=1 Tax=Shinella granuli TaxID=323621 RepID=UPI0035EB32D8